MVPDVYDRASEKGVGVIFVKLPKKKIEAGRARTSNERKSDALARSTGIRRLD